MTLRILLFSSSLFLSALFAVQCAKDPAPDQPLLPDPALLAAERAAAEKYTDISPQSYPMDLPLHVKNAGGGIFPINDQRAMLGRVLFYDKNLSQDRSVSCASCHIQSFAFSDTVAFSRGINGAVTARNSIPLGMFVSFANGYEGSGGGNNLSLFWDGRAHSIAEQCRETMANPREMGMKMDEVVARVKAQPYYPYYFRLVNGDPEISEMRVLSALMEFVNSVSSANTRFDEGADGVRTDEIVYRDFTNFTPQENAGKTLYMRHCSGCHGVNNAVAVRQLACNGLDAEYADPGAGRMGGLPGMFKVPTLRNVALTAPYMHDGRFKTLEEVVEHYNSGIEPSVALDVALRDSADPGQPKRLNLNSGQKEALVAFLHTLTDKNIRTEKRWSDPFQ